MRLIRYLSTVAHATAAATVSLSLLAPVPGLAAGDPLRPAVFEETLREAVPVSGAIRAGLVSGDLSKPVVPSNLGVLLPTSTNRQLCVEIASRDGRYLARWQTTLADNVAGHVPLAFPTGYSDALKIYRVAELAVLAWLAEDCGKSPEAFLIASWDGRPDPNSFTVIVNSGRVRSSFALTGPDGAVKTLPCELVEGAQLVSYDTECHVHLPVGVNLATARIERRRGSNQFPSVRIPLLLPATPE